MSSKIPTSCVASLEVVPERLELTGKDQGPSEHGQGVIGLSRVPTQTRYSIKSNCISVVSGEKQVKNAPLGYTITRQGAARKELCKRDRWKTVDTLLIGGEREREREQHPTHPPATACTSDDD